MDRTDQEAVRDTLRDSETYSVLVARYQERLERYIRRLGISDPETGKDILQECFIKAYLNLNDYDDALPFSSWIYRIAHNETMAHYRRMKRRPQALPDSDWSLFEEIPDEIDIAHDVDAKLRGERIARALKELRPLYRDVIVLRFFEEKSYDEIADILTIPMGTVATYLSRAKRDLIRLLEHEHITGLYYEHHA